MFAIKRYNFKFLNKVANVASSIQICEPKLSKLNPIQVAHLTSKALRDPNYKRPKPFPYLEKPCSTFPAFNDSTLSRFDENTKIIIVEGNIGVGKATLAKKLAEEFDLRHIPACSLESTFITNYGYDLRDLNPQLPDDAQYYDIEAFYTNPTHKQSTNFQIQMFEERFSQYIDVLNHVLNTGEGCVMEGSIFTDFVYAKTMVKHGYMTKEALKYYDEISSLSLYKLIRPHLVLYLDAPVETCLDRIKKRNIPYEVNGKVLTPSYLKSIDNLLKTEYLKTVPEKSELLVYDWTEPGDVDFIVDDIERIDFDRYRDEDSVCREWWTFDDWDFIDLRCVYTRGRRELLNSLFNQVVPLDCPEMWTSAESGYKLAQLHEQIPGQKFSKGFNADLGDTGVLFKAKSNYYTDPWA